MESLLYRLVAWIARVHDRIQTLNDAYETHFTDKDLHFLVIGAIGMGLVFVLHPLFSYLVRHRRTLTITWIYVFTVLIVLTFAIEIGQGYTHSGTMDFDDIVSGILGFFLFFAIYAAIRGIILLVTRPHRRHDRQDRYDRYS